MPGWLITSTDTDFNVFRQTFPAGEVSLGGTGFGGGSFSMYVVAIGEASSGECDPAPLQDTDGLPDGDGDGVTDDQDNCLFFANGAQSDVDQDTVGDLCQCGDVDTDGDVDTADGSQLLPGPAQVCQRALGP